MDEPTYKLQNGSHEFTPFGGPLDSTDSSPLLEQLGRAILGWSRVEYIATALAIHLNKEEASPILYDDDPNSKLPMLLKLIGKWLTAHPPYAHLAPAMGDEFRALVVKDIELRNEIVHSLLESSSPEGAFTARRLRRTGPDLWSATTTTYAPETAEYMSSQAALVARHLNEICKAVFQRTQ